MPIRVVLADDSCLVREGVTRLLETADDIDVVAACEDYDSLLAGVESEAPDIVLTDIRMPPTGTEIKKLELAVATADQLDRDALAELSTVHRREEQR